MEEKRTFFRVKNTGQFKARLGSHSLEVLDLSASSIAVKPKVYLPITGSLELNIHYVLVRMNYQLLKMSTKDMVLVFKDDEQVNSMLALLKWLKYQEH